MALSSARPQPVPPPVSGPRVPAHPASSPRAPEGPPENETEVSREPLRVALDLRRADRMPVSCYAEGLLRGFAAIGARVRFTVIGGECEPPAGLEIADWIDPERNGTEKKKTGKGPLDAGDVDLVHGFGPGVPAIRAPRFLLTLHHLPESQEAGWATRLIRRWRLQRSVRRNVRLVATSGQPRDVLETLAPRIGEAVWTIHPGPGKPREGLNGGPRHGGSNGSERGSARSGRWFLTTAGASRSENMDFLISAMALWYRKRLDAPRLIWAGGEAVETDARWSRIPARARHHIRVMPIGSEEARDAFFDEAIAFIIPELEPTHAYDALEAMSRGVPVLCARRRPFTDLLGHAPLWFDPRDSSTLWRALDALLDDPTLRPDVVSRGLREAARYDWRETAEMTLGAYRQLMRTFPGAANGRQ